MYRKTLALSLTSLFCLPALAQSGVQLYGSADAFFKYGKVMGDSTAGIDDGGIGNSFFGLRGEEELGAGLKAVFVLEEGFSIDSGKSCCMSEEDSSSNSAAKPSPSKPTSASMAPSARSPLGANMPPAISPTPTTPCKA